ncbi:unnamed protein product [Discula destructiva]
MDLIKEMLDLVVPDQLSLSPDGKQVVYTGRTKLDHKPKSEEHKRAIWMADLGLQKSSKRLTEGHFDDQDAKWSPDGKLIAFLSDRGDRGKSCAIYLLSPSGHNEPRALMAAASELKISKYRFSPDGKHIFFIATPGMTSEKKSQHEAGDDAQVWDQDWDFAHFYRVDIESGSVKALFKEGVNVVDFALNDDGTELALVTGRTPHIESSYLHGQDIRKFRLTAEGLQATGSLHLPKDLHDIIWAGSTIYFITYNDPQNTSTGFAVYATDSETDSSGDLPYKRIDHEDGGEESCALGGFRKAGNKVLVYVQHDMGDQLRVLNGSTLLRQKKRISSYDVVPDKDNSDKLIMVVASGDIDKPTEVFAVDTATASLKLQLSDHSANFKHLFSSNVQFLSCSTLDGKKNISGIYFKPASAPPNKPLPTYVSIHGGPYYRQTNAFDSSDSWVLFAPLLLSAGIGVLLPDYRGSSSRGERFASYAKYPGLGVYDEPDIVAMTQHAVEKGLADPDHLAVGGWSQGGYLSYLSAVRNGSHGFGWKVQMCCTRRWHL